MNRRTVITFLAAAVLALGTFPVARADDAASKARAAAETSWHSPSLTMETVTGPNGVVTTRVALGANALWGITDKKVVETVIPGVYALRGWGIASSFAIEAPGGWIIVDTGDSTRVAAEMREMLERTLGRKIKVAAILLTHWHYADGIAAWLDAGTEIWGHEHLDRNRRTSTGVSVLSGLYQARAVAQFVCEFCRANLRGVPPPADRNRDPWPGSPDARMEEHQSVWRRRGSDWWAQRTSPSNDAGGAVARTARPRALTLPSATPQGLRSSGSADTAECRYCFTYQYVASSAVGRIAAVVPRFPPSVSPM